MTAWTADELTRIGNAEELDIASRSADGGLTRFVTIWVVRHGDDVYIRSAYGAEKGCSDAGERQATAVFAPADWREP